MILPFLLFVFVIQILCDFHLLKTLHLPTSSPISSIKNINNTKLGIIEIATSTNISKASIFSGQNFSQKIKEISAGNLATDAKFVGEDILLNFGGNFTFNENKGDSKWKFNYSNLLSNIVVTSKYMLVAQELGCASLILLNLTTMKESVLKIDNSSSCEVSKYTHISNLNNGKIVFVSNKNFYFLNNETLQILQKYKDNSTNLNIYNSLYTASNNLDSTILLEQEPLSVTSKIKQYQVVRMNKENGEYESKNFFSLIATNITVISPNYAMVLEEKIFGNYNGYLHKWSLSSQIVANDFKTASQSLAQQRTIALRANEEEFVTLNYNNATLNFYNISSSFTISKIKSVSLSSGIVINDAFYCDPLQSLIVVSNSQIYNVNTSSYTIKNNITNTLKCFNMTQVKNDKTGEYDLFVVVCFSSFFSSNYYIEMRRVNDLSLVQNYTLDVSKENASAVRLIGQKSWNNYFVVFLQTSLSSYEDPTTTLLFKIEDEKIINTGIRTTNISSIRSRAAGEYIVSFKYNLTATQSPEYLRFFHYSNLSEVYKKYYESSSTGLGYSNFGLISNGDILVVENSQLYWSDIYVLTGSIDSWFHGRITRQTTFAKSIPSDKEVGYIIFPTKKVYYLYTMLTSVSETNPYKVIYNIDDLPIRETYPVPAWLSSGLFVPEKEGSDCGNFFGIPIGGSSGNFKKFVNCQPSQGIISVPYYPWNASTSIMSENFFASSSGKHLILTYTSRAESEIDIRSISDISTQRWLFRDDSIIGINPIVNVDIIGNQVYFNRQKSLEVYNINSNEIASDYGVTSIICADGNPRGNFIFSGVKLNSNNISTIVFQDHLKSSPTSVDFDGIVQSIAISPKGTLASAYSSTKVYVWKIQSSSLLPYWSREYTDVKSIKFNNENIFIINRASEFEVVDLSKQNRVSALKLSFIVGTAVNKIAVSPDNQFYAFSESSKVVNITTNSREKIINFKLPSETDTIADFEFQDDNTLLIAAKSGNLYVISPTPCPDTFTNFEGICLCAENKTEIENLCKCSRHFELLENNCVCPNQYVYKDPGICECGNNQTEVGEKCECKENFELKEFKCVCEKPFTFLNEQCTCGENKTKILDACECNQHFIKTNDLCICPSSSIFKDGKCLCGANQTDVQGVCTCNNNFVLKEDVCVCQSEFIFKENTCRCDNNRTQIGNSCPCSEGFMSINESCICPPDLIFENEKCFCSANSTQINSTCECDENFIKVNEKCICPQNFTFSNSECSCSSPNFILEGNSCICHESFQFEENECRCKGVIENKECKACSFPSKASCDGYEVSFYIIIAGSAVVLLAIIGVGVFLIRKKRMQKKKLLSGEDDEI